MLQGKVRITTVILMVFALLIGTASLSLAAAQNGQQLGMMGGSGSGGTGWGCGQGWTGGQGIGWSNGMWGGSYGVRGAQFMAQGQIVSIDTQASTITITLNRASPNLLTKLGITNADLPIDEAFKMSPKVKVWGCGWHNGKWGSGSLTLADLKKGYNVNLMGYFDKTSGQPIVSQINVWLY